MEILRIKKVRKNAIVPERATSGSAGLDLCACIDEPIIIPARGNAFVPTGIAIALPSDGYAGMVFARSGLAIKHGIGLLNGVGVVDSDYRGEISVGLVNQLDTPFEINPMERIAQLVIIPVSSMPVAEVEELDDTDRGTGGFGSTGRV